MTSRGLRLRIPPAARRFLAPFAGLAREQRLPAFVVGGCVRDWLLGRATSDIDLVTEGEPGPLAEACARRLRARAERFGQFGTWRVVDEGGFRVDFATARAERYPEPAALPIIRPAPLPDDLKRRDFTVNAMALPLDAVPAAGEAIVDPFGGRADLAAGRLRLLHAQSLRDDPTRAFRAARYAARFALTPDKEFLRQAREALAEGHAARLSPHRLLAELWKVLAEREAQPALRLLRDWGYLRLLHPRLPDPPAAARRPDERLGAMALALGPEAGEEFLSAFPLEHALATELRTALKAAAAWRSPRAPLPEAAARVLRLGLPKLPKAALSPVWLGGADLKALGLEPSARFRELLDEAARLQWEGKLKSRAQALAWLRERAAR